MAKELVAFFSASGKTEKLAKKLALTIGADLHEIEPKVSYTLEDLNWRDANSRSTVEMRDRAFRPEISSDVRNMNQYSTVYVAFPIWWYIAPTIVNTFLEKYDLKGKKIIPVATSGGSNMGKTNEELAPSCEGADLREGRVFSPNASEEELKSWAESYR